MNKNNRSNEQSIVSVDMQQLKNHYYRLIEFCTEALLAHDEKIPERGIRITRQLIAGYPIEIVAEWHSLSKERVRQLFEKTIKQVRRDHVVMRKKLDEIQNENAQLKAENLLLREKLVHQSIPETSEEILALLQIETSKLALSKRTLNIFEKLNVENFGQIPKLDVHDLLATPNCGKKTITEIKQFLRNINLSLGMSFSQIVKELNKQDIYQVKQLIVSSEPKFTIELKGPIAIPDIDIPLPNNQGKKSPETMMELNLSNGFPRKHGLKWTEQEMDQIQEDYAIGLTIEEIALNAERTKISIIAKLTQLLGKDWITSDTYRDENGNVHLK